MSDALTGSTAKVERAKKHTQELDEAIRAFYATNPYRLGTKRNPDTRHLIYYMDKVDEIPALIPTIAGDVIQNLRSALDHLAYQLVRAGLGREPTANEARSIAFPITQSATATAQDFESLMKGRLSGASPNVFNAVRALKPYKGGNDTLWLLHQLNNIDKHRLLITVGSAIHGLNLRSHLADIVREHYDLMFGEDSPSIPDLWVTEAGRFCPLKVGDELFIDAPDAEPKQDMGFTFDVAFSEPQFVVSEPILETLQQMVDLVDNLLPVFRPLL